MFAMSTHLRCANCLRRAAVTDACAHPKICMNLGWIGRLGCYLFGWPTAPMPLMRLNRHAVGRAKERYQIDLTETDVASILSQCQAGVPLKHTEGDELHEVRIWGSPLYVIYWREMDRLITFLPPTIIKDNGHIAIRKRKKARRHA